MHIQTITKAHPPKAQMTPVLDKLNGIVGLALNVQTLIKGMAA